MKLNNARDIAVGIVLARYFEQCLLWISGASLTFIVKYAPELEQSYVMGILITMGLSAMLFVILAYRALSD